MTDSRTTRSSTGMIHHPEPTLFVPYPESGGGGGEASPMSLLGNSTESEKVSGDPVMLESSDDSNVVFRTIPGDDDNPPRVVVSVYYV